MENGFNLLLVSAHFVEQVSIVIDSSLQVSMRTSGSASEIEEYLQVSAHQWLGLGQHSSGLQEFSHVIEEDGNVRMTQSKAPWPRPSALIEVHVGRESSHPNFRSPLGLAR